MMQQIPLERWYDYSSTVQISTGDYSLKIFPTICPPSPPSMTCCSDLGVGEGGGMGALWQLGLVRGRCDRVIKGLLITHLACLLCAGSIVPRAADLFAEGRALSIMGERIRKKTSLCRKKPAINPILLVEARSITQKDRGKLAWERGVWGDFAINHILLIVARG